MRRNGATRTATLVCPEKTERERERRGEEEGPGSRGAVGRDWGCIGQAGQGPTRKFFLVLVASGQLRFHAAEPDSPEPDSW